MVNRLMFVLLMLVIITSSALADSLYDGNEPARDRLQYKYSAGPGETAAWSINDIQFTSPELYPTPENLSDAEVFIVSGAATSGEEGVGLAAWVDELRYFVAEYYRENGTAPATFDFATAKSLDSYANYPNSFADLWLNPITGDYSDLSVPDTSPGGVFVHFLTEEEKYHFAVRDAEFKRMVYLNSFPDHDAEVGRTVRSPSTEPFYVQIYGESGRPILQRIYIW